MKKTFVFLAAIACLAACKMAVKLNPPPAPATAAAVMENIKGKSYKTATIGLLSPFQSDSSINWNIMEEDTTSFFQKWAKEQMAFNLDFSKDSSCSFYNAFDKKNTKAVYSADTDPNLGYNEPHPGIKLRLKYNGSMEFGGDTTTSIMTLSFLVRGISEKELILETGQSFNRRTMVVWLKAN